MENFFFYNSIGFAFSVGMFTTLEFISNPSNFRRNMKNHINTIKFWTIDKVISIYSLYKNIFPSVKVNNTENIDGLIYNKKGELCDLYSSDLEAVYEKHIIDENEYFVKNHVNDPKPNNFLIGCEIKYLDEELGIEKTQDINSELKKFCVTNLKLDKNFMKAFMKKIFDINVESKYVLNSITTNCEILTISDKQTLYVYDESYEIKDNE